MLATDDGPNAWCKYFDQKTAAKREAIVVVKKGALAGLLFLLELSNVTKQPMRSIYPNVFYKLIALSTNPESDRN